MGNKNKTVSFRIREDKFETLRSLADDHDLSLSSIFRDYVDKMISHDGHVELVPEHDIRDEASTISTDFPLTVEVPKSLVRDHEQLELECEHLRDQLDEYKQYASQLERELEAKQEQEDEMVRLEDIDYEAGTSLLIE